MKFSLRRQLSPNISPTSGTRVKSGFLSSKGVCIYFMGKLRRTDVFASIKSKNYFDNFFHVKFPDPVLTYMEIEKYAPFNSATWDFFHHKPLILRYIFIKTKRNSNINLFRNIKDFVSPLRDARKQKNKTVILKCPFYVTYQPLGICCQEKLLNSATS